MASAPLLVEKESVQIDWSLISGRVRFQAHFAVGCVSRPISVGVAGYGLQYYGSGVFDDCGQILEHAVMVVG